MVMAVNQTFAARWREISPVARARCKNILSQSPRGTPQAIMMAAAPPFSTVRETSAMFVRFDPNNLQVTVLSHAGEVGRADFPAANPVTLMAPVINQRLSLHVPDLSGLDRQSPLARLAHTRGRCLLGHTVHPYEVIGALAGPVISQALSGEIIAILPRSFNADSGAVLLTPLGFDAPGHAAFGFIYEHKNSRFSLEAINEARAFSSLFMLFMLKSARAYRRA